jgi:DNA-binding XRE family transcriptional regulator
MTKTAFPDVLEINPDLYEGERNEYGYPFDLPYYKWEKDDLVLKIVDLEARLEKATDNRPKLTDRDVQLIRRLHANAKASHSELARSFDVNPRTIGRIISGEYHKDV